MASLTGPQKRRIVELLAREYSPSDVARILKEEGVTVSRQAIAHYDPRVLAGERMSAELKALFYKLRDEFRKNVDEIPLAGRAFRLRLLQDIVDDPDYGRSPRIRMDVVKLAEQMVGEMFVKGKDDRPGDEAGKVPLEAFESSLDKIYGQSNNGGSDDPDSGTADQSGGAGLPASELGG